MESVPLNTLKVATRGAKHVLPVPLQRLARAGLHAIARRLYRPRTASREIFGSTVKIVICDSISALWYDRDIDWLPSLKYLVEQRRHRCQSIFYIGAHHCVYGIALSHAVPGARILAVEANPEHCRTARANIGLNGSPDIEVVAAAIADFEGELQFTYGHRVATGEAGIPTRPVRAHTIDSLAAQHGAPGLVILDVEGYELQALRAAVHILQSEVDWCVEVHCGCGLERYGGSLAAVLDRFPPDRFELLMSQDYGNSPVVPLDRASPLVSGRFHLLALRR